MDFLRDTEEFETLLRQYERKGAVPRVGLLHLTGKSETVSPVFRAYLA